MFYTLLCSRFYKSQFERPHRYAQNKFHITNITYGGFGSIAETLKNHSKPFEKWGHIDFDFAKEQAEPNKFKWNWTTGGFGSISETLKNKSLPFERWGRLNFSWAQEPQAARNSYGGYKKVKRHHRQPRSSNKFHLTNFTYGGEGSLIDTLENHSKPFDRWAHIDFDFAKEQQQQPARNGKTYSRRHSHSHHRQQRNIKVTNFTYGGEGSLIDTLKNHSKPFDRWAHIDFDFAKEQQANKFKITNFTHGGFGSLRETLKDPRKSFYKWGHVDFTFGDDAKDKQEETSTSQSENSNVHPHEMPGRWARVSSNNFPRKHKHSIILLAGAKG